MNGVSFRLVFVVLLAPFFGFSAFAQQTASVERTYKYPRAQVEGALRSTLWDHSAPCA